MKATGSLQPFRWDPNRACGKRLQLMIGPTSLPPISLEWGKRTIRVRIEQPHKDTDFTMVYVLFSKSGATHPAPLRGMRFFRVPHYWRKNGMLDIRINTRHAVPFPYIVFGQYRGSVVAGDAWAYVVLQAGGEKLEPTEAPSTIITPGSPGYAESLKELGSDHGI